MQSERESNKERGKEKGDAGKQNNKVFGSFTIRRANTILQIQKL